MTLEFRLLVIDDQGVPGQAVDDLTKHLDEQGFSLNVVEVSDPSEEKLRKVAKQNGQKFDLVIVDYYLGHGRYGARVLQKFRTDMRFTEMVFYSERPEADLHREMWEAGLEGVFVARRSELDDVLRGIADIVIGKAVDLNHMRGIAMAEVAEIDVVMGSTICGVLRGAKTDTVREMAGDLERSYLETRARRDREVVKMLQKEGFVGVVEKGVMFSSHDRWKAICALSELVSGVSAQKERVKNYEEEVLRRRNKLAHMMEGRTEDGRTVLKSDARSGSGEREVDESWMRSFRLKLREHRDAMQTVCRAIDSQFGGVGGPEKPKKP